MTTEEGAGMLDTPTHDVIPAKAGIPVSGPKKIPAFAGMTWCL